jgi:two-component system sensor histidine kinase RpfC
MQGGRTIRDWITGLRARLAAREDSEHEMSLNRLAFVVLMTGYLLISPVPRQGLALSVMALGLVVLIGIFAHILYSPAPNPTRRLVAAFADLSTISFQIHLGSDTGAVFYPLLLWTVMGNGFRFGVRWLAIAGLVAFCCFLAVVLATPFWRAYPPLSAGLLAALLIIPAYSATLIRKLEAARQQAEVANAAKTMFLATVSHELRTPLNAIMGAQSALLDTKLDHDQREMSGIARQGAQILLGAIEELLDFSRIEAGAMQPNPVDFALPDLLVEVMGLFRVAAAEKNIRLTLHIAAGCPPGLRGERRYLRDILQNLIGNAVKFTRQGGVLVAVRTAAGEGENCILTVEVIDTGIGIAPASINRVFDSFSQADNTILDEFGGTGLGLSICRKLAAALSGTVEVTSALGQGSTFTFAAPFAVLPRAAGTGPSDTAVVLAGEVGPVRARLAVVAPEQSARLLQDASGGPHIHVVGGMAVSESSGSGNEVVILVADADICAGHDTRWYCLTRIRTDFTRENWTDAMTLARRILDFSAERTGEVIPFRPARRRLRVLLAEDNVLNQRVITRMLERAGHQVSIARDGDAALDLMESATPDVVLMDVNMPILNGLEATRLYRAASLDLPHLPIYGLTADATDRMHQGCLAAGMDACLTKPVDQHRLLTMLEELGAASAAPAAPEPAPESEPATPQPELLDDSRLQGLMDLGGTDFTRQMVRLFDQQAEIARHEMQEACRHDDLFRFRDVAHSLLSSAANVGADRVGAEAGRLQTVAARDFAAGGDALLAPLLAEIDAVRVEIARRSLG